MQPVQQHAGQGQQAPQEPLRRRISNFLAHTVDRFRIALLVVLIAAAAFLVGYFVYNEINKKLIYDSTLDCGRRAGPATRSGRQKRTPPRRRRWRRTSRTSLNRLIARYPRQYGGQRGLFLRADLNYAKKAWDAALKDYETLAARFPKSYLAPVSLFNAARLRRGKGRHGRGAEAVRAGLHQPTRTRRWRPARIFNAGRIDEAKGAWADAQKKYEQMDSLYSQSVWTKLAKNRLVELKVQGKIK